jgi:HEAT repeat protein
MAMMILPTVGGDASDIPGVAALADDPDPQVRSAVPTSLLFLGGRDKQPPEQVLKLDEKLLEDPSPAVRREAMRAMWGRPVSPAVEVKLIELSRSENTETSHDAVYYALSTRPGMSKAVAERLVEVMKAPMTWGDSQGRAAWGLSHGILSPEAKGVALEAFLVEIDETLNEYVRSNCVFGLGAIGGDEAVKKLKGLAENDESEQIRREASQALSRLGHSAG